MATQQTYFAKGHEIWLRNADIGGAEELFLTVHPTTDCPMTPDDQAKVLVALLNDL